MRRTASILLIATIGLAISSAASADAQALPRGVADVEPASSKVIDGVTYYYDADGNPLYYDDPVHYDYPRRFYYRNGGWVMARSGHGHHHSRYSNTGVYKRRGQIVQPGQTNQTGQGVSVRKSAQTGRAGQRDKGTTTGQDTSRAKTGQAIRGAPRGKSGQTGQGISSGKLGRRGARASGGN